MRRRWRRHERLLAVVFLYISLDEATALHELTVGPLKGALGLSGALAFGWILIAVPLTGLLGVFMLGYLRALPRSSRRWFLASAALYVGGAAGVEMLGALLWSTGDADTIRYALATSLEEALEMVALVLFLSTLSTLRRIADATTSHPSLHA